MQVLPFVLRVQVPVPSVKLSILRERTMLISFSEEVIGFTEDKILVVGGTLATFRGNTKDFLVEILESKEDVYLAIEPSVVRNRMGQWNTGSNVLRIGEK